MKIPEEREFGELMEVHGLEEVQNPQISSQENVNSDNQIADSVAQNSETVIPATLKQGSGSKAPDTKRSGNTSTQNRDEGRPYVVTITQENMDKVSILHKGLIQNPDGTLSRTPQYNTWTQNPNMQLQKMYETTPGMPAEIEEWYHPETSRLDLDWSYEGEWIMIPTGRDGREPDYRNCRMGRLERYIDTDGKIRRAVSYGAEGLKLKVWFHMKDMKAAFPDWHIPHPCPYYNGKKFNKGQRRQIGPNPNLNPTPPSSQRSNPLPRDQSVKDIQGRRGSQQTHRARGRAFRGNRGYQPRGRVNTYQEWDSQQASSSSSSHPKDSQQWEKESWDDYQKTVAEEKGARPKEHRSRDQYRDHRPQNESQRYQDTPREDYQKDRRRERDQEYDQREPQEGYYTKEYADQKRDQQQRSQYRDEYQDARPREDMRQREDSRGRYREKSRDRQSDRRQRERSLSSRRYRERNHSPRDESDSGRGRGGRIRERSPSPRSNNSRVKGGYERRGSGASYGDR